MPTADSTNSYCTRAEADDYFASRLHSGAWTGAVNADKEVALIMATRQIDLAFEFDGSTTEIGQGLQWPRIGMFGPTGEVIEEDEIPNRLIEATAEMAMALLSTDRTLDSDSDALSSLGVGPISISFKQSNTPSRKPIPDIVAELLSLFGTLKSGKNQTGSCIVPLSRV